MNNKISIVMPTYNNEKTIGNSIRSILQQNYSNWELIIVDDGSVDKTKKICDKFASYDTRIKYYKQKNSGVSSARNYGLHKINGDLLMFVDADDSLTENALKILNSTFDKNDLDLCIYSWYEINNGSKQRHYYNRTELSATKEEYFKKIVYSSNWNNYSGGYPWNKIWKVSTLKNNRMVFFNEKLKMLEDRLFVLEALDKIKRLKVINTPLYNYYIRDKSLSHSKDSKKVMEQAYELYSAIKVQYQYVKKKHISALINAQKSNLQIEINYFMTVLKSPSKVINKKQYFKVLSDFRNTKFRFLTLKYLLKYIIVKTYLFKNSVLRDEKNE